MNAKKKCKEMIHIYYGDWPHSIQCTRNAVKDGYCKQHHPDAVQKRRDASAKRHEEKRKQDPLYRLCQATERIAVLEEALYRIISLGHGTGSGLCYSCTNIANDALRNPTDKGAK